MNILYHAAAHLHSIDEHASQPEWDLLRELFASHGHLKAVAKVNVRDLATHTVQHEVGGVSVPQT